MPWPGSLVPQPSKKHPLAAGQHEHALNLARSADGWRPTQHRHRQLRAASRAACSALAPTALGSSRGRLIDETKSEPHRRTQAGRHVLSCSLRFSRCQSLRRNCMARPCTRLHGGLGSAGQCNFVMPSTVIAGGQSQCTHGWTGGSPTATNAANPRLNRCTQPWRKRSSFSTEY